MLRSKSRKYSKAKSKSKSKLKAKSKSSKSKLKAKSKSSKSKFKAKSRTLPLLSKPILTFADFPLQSVIEPTLDRPILFIGVLTKNPDGYYTGKVSTSSGNTELQLRLTVDELLQQFLQPRLCKGDVTESYIQNSFGDNEYFFLMFYLAARTRNQSTIEPVGFAMAKSFGSELYVDVICSNKWIYTLHSGRLLLEHIEKFARQMKFQEIVLSSLPVVLLYYPKFGYEHLRSCNGIPDKRIISERLQLQEILQQKGFPQTNDRAIEQPDIQKFMVSLYRLGYAPDDDKCSPFTEFGTLKTNEEMFMDLFGEKECHNRGFIMRKCLPLDYTTSLSSRR